MSDVSHYLMVALCSCLAYPVVYVKVAPYLLKSLVFQRYASLDKAKQKFAHMITTSLIYTAVVSPCALYVHHFDQDLAHTRKNNILRYDSPTVRYISALLLGYTTGESVVNIMVVGRSGVSWFSFVVHHVITCYATLVTCVYPSLPAFANFAVATEFSTIWLNIRLLLKEFGIPQSSTVNKVNNLAFFLSFSYVRVWLLIFDFYIPLTSLLLTKEFYTIELPVVVASVCASQFYLFINLYWYGLMCRMIPKVISGSKKDD
ncbi:Hypp6425 [Branchiostoma lanceolatum]|uniref:Hypp6425 protein n=1 Tax=Branchiostoma lanceolatum TaxID=7740 RepID=A0A8K0E4G7_BRALA|nr:Hypp6425 [Branchiostoma lanceolatum]